LSTVKEKLYFEKVFKYLECLLKETEMFTLKDVPIA
jgi:hypothetical protein